MSREPDPRAGGTAIDRLAYKIDPDTGLFDIHTTTLKAASMALVRLERENIKLRDLCNAQAAAIKGLENRLRYQRDAVAMKFPVV